MRLATIQRAEQACWRARIGDPEAGVATAHPGSEPCARFVRLSVDPAYRRGGVGRLLFEAVRADLLAEGRRTAEARRRLQPPGPVPARPAATGLIMCG